MNKILRFCYSSNTRAREEEEIESGDLIEEKKKSDNMVLKFKETFYVSHGSPALAVDDSIPAWKFFTSWKERFPTPPSAILVVSGHWDTHAPTVNVVDRNDTIYDFYGFPKSMYKVCLLL